MGLIFHFMALTLLHWEVWLRSVGQRAETFNKASQDEGVTEDASGCEQAYMSWCLCIMWLLYSKTGGIVSSSSGTWNQNMGSDIFLYPLTGEQRHLVVETHSYLPVNLVIVAVVISRVAPDGELQNETFEERKRTTSGQTPHFSFFLTLFLPLDMMNLKHIFNLKLQRTLQILVCQNYFQHTDTDEVSFSKDPVKMSI